ncbi:MAG: succinate dehydrogenase, cytochrome b556 subunit [Pseudomonadota bacterium]
MSNVELQDKRPLSPHLSIYKPIPTMVASIVNRITGGALYFGTILLAWWLFAAASGEAYFEWVNGFFGSFIGRLILFGYTWALIHHMVGGLRHLMWDMGKGFDKHFTTKLAWASWVASIGATFLIWIIAYTVR